MKGIIKGLTGSVLFPLWLTRAGSWQEFLLFLAEAALSKSAVFMVKVPNFYSFHYKEYFLIINFTKKYVFFPIHHYLQLRKLKWWTLTEKLVWVCLWSQTCCFYRHFWVGFKPAALVLTAVRRLLPSSCGFCSSPRVWCGKCGSTSRTRGNTGCSQTAPRMCLLWVPLGLERGCSHSGNHEDRQGEAAYLQCASKSHREWALLLQIVLILTEKTDPDLAWGARVTPVTPMSELSWITSNLQYFLKLQHSAIIEVGLGV